jgi:hypothetical protein
MGSIGGTRWQRSVMKATSLSVSLCAMLDLCLSLSLSLLGRTLRKLFEPKKFLKLHVCCLDVVAPPSYVAQPSYTAHPTDQTTTPSPSPTNVDQTTLPLPSPTHSDQITLPLPSLTHSENSTLPMLPRPCHASHCPYSMG